MGTHCIQQEPPRFPFHLWWHGRPEYCMASAGKKCGAQTEVAHMSALLNHRAEQQHTVGKQPSHSVQEMPPAQSTYVWTVSLCSMMLLPKVPLVFSTTMYLLNACTERVLIAFPFTSHSLYCHRKCTQYKANFCLENRAASRNLLHFNYYLYTCRILLFYNNATI